MLLEGKTAVIYGASGPIGGAAAKAFAREGARVFISSRNQEKLEPVAEAIRQRGGQVETAVVDAYDEGAVDGYVDGVVGKAGRIDISFNAIGYGDVQKMLMEISVADFMQPIANAMRAQFLTTRAAARHMIKAKSGVVLAFGGGGSQTMAGLGGFKIALDAIEGLRRQWAIELAPHGIRVLTLKSGGIPEGIGGDFDPGMREKITASIDAGTPAGKAATLEDVGNIAAFVVSDRAKAIGTSEINMSAGAIVD